MIIAEKEWKNTGIKRRIFAVLLTVIFAALVALSFSACENFDDRPVAPEPVELTFLKAEGEAVKNEAGEEVYLRGVNLGGLFVTEHWMTGFKYTTPSNDFKSLTRTFIERFGEEKTKALWAEYRSNWWTELDFKKCADMGMNVIRLPFTYMNVDFDALKLYEYENEDGSKVVVEYKYAGENYDFSDLDAFVERAAEYGMYTILDLHGAYGSQNGQDHSGEVIGSASDVTFFYNAKMQDLTVKLWSALSAHYKDNPHVAGYDILNEPGEKAGLTSTRHWEFYDKVYDAIRANGDEHIVIFESCWDGKDLPQPAVYGWENCMYSFHHYTNNNVDTEANILEHGQSWNEKIEGITERNFGVPIYMGEFTNYTSVAKWDYILDFLNRLNWHWTSWTYKVWGNMPWGIVNIRAAADDKVDAVNDEYEDIVAKFKMLRTSGDSAKEYTFSGTDTTLESVFKRYTAAPAQTAKLEEETYTFDSDRGYLAYQGMVGGTSVFNLVDNYYSSSMLKLVRHPSNDGSVYLTNNSRYLCVFASVGSKYLTLKSFADTTENAARFYPVPCGDGWAFVSRSACKYITADSNGLLVAAASTIDEAVIFYR